MRFDVPDLLDRVERAGGAVRHALWWRWRLVRGQTGSFHREESSDRSRALTNLWDQNWPGAQPVGYLLREAEPGRWVRFHSLPESKRYAESAEEYHEILRRHRTVLDELRGDSPWAGLVVVAVDWGPRDHAGGWSRGMLPGAWPWRVVVREEPELKDYCWVTSNLTAENLERLLLSAADDEAHFLLSSARIDWLFCPYDGGVDVFLGTTGERDALRDRHSDWLSAYPGGL